MKKYERYKAIIFDMDGTLVDSGKMHETAWQTALDTYEIPIDRAFMRSLAGVPTFETVQILLDKHQMHSVDANQVADLKNATAKNCLRNYVKPSPLLSVAEHFFAKTPMALGTGATTDEAEIILSACEISHLISAIVGADQVKNPKPAPDTFLLCAERLGVKPKDCLVFEDAELGINAAKAAGMDVLDVQKEFGFENDYFL